MTETCEMDMGTVGTTCPANPTGACAIMMGGIGFTFNYYFTDADDLTAAEMVCTSTGGTWTGS